MVQSPVTEKNKHFRAVWDSPLFTEFINLFRGAERKEEWALREEKVAKGKVI